MHAVKKRTYGNTLFTDGSAVMLSTPDLRKALKNPGVAPRVITIP